MRIRTGNNSRNVWHSATSRTANDRNNITACSTRRWSVFVDGKYDEAISATTISRRNDKGHLQLSTQPRTTNHGKYIRHNGCILSRVSPADSIETRQYRLCSHGSVHPPQLSTRIQNFSARAMQFEWCCIIDLRNSCRQANQARNSNRRAYDIRDEFKDYFNTVGAVDFQHELALRS